MQAQIGQYQGNPNHEGQVKVATTPYGSLAVRAIKALPLLFWQFSLHIRYQLPENFCGQAHEGFYQYRIISQILFGEHCSLLIRSVSGYYTTPSTYCE